jgi:hypothetical protein
MILASHAFYLKIFLERGINVFTWNYRGYGRSKGSANPDAFKDDIHTVIDYLRNELGLKGKIGIYGRSLGGIPTTWAQDKVDMIIIDRSFSNLNDMAIWKYHGPLASAFLRVFSCGWQVQNDFNFLRPFTSSQS